MLLELGLEALEQRERVCRAAGEASEDAIVVQPAHLACAGFHDDVAEGDLPIAAQRDAVAAAHGQNGGAVEGLDCH